MSEPHDATHGLEIRGLAKSFMLNGGPRPVFNRIDLDIDDGEFVAIVGESGSGKTTLLRIIAGLERADAGSVASEGGRSMGSVASAEWCFRNRACCRG
jgi:ABC-type nitrate/sulfonate/bicarbonate transport system ATPase subunit